MSKDFLTDIFFYFLATVSFVPLFKKIGLGSIAGYLFSGLILGPNVLSLLENSGEIETISDIGIILLMFIVGLELSLSRLSVLKNPIIKYGSLQFLFTNILLTPLLFMMTKEWGSAILIAMALSLSSTAFSLKYLRDSDKLTKSYGQISLSILLFQDIIVIPIVAIIPLIAQQTTFNLTQESLITGGIFIGFVLTGKYILPMLISKIDQFGNKEIFISTNLLIISGCALLASSLGLSKALGAFLAGLFLSESALKNKIQTFTLPLKSMLLGVFFMAFGLKLNLSIFNEYTPHILIGTGLFMGIKCGLTYLLVRSNNNKIVAKIVGVTLCQGGEFSLLVLSVGHYNNLIDSFTYQFSSSITILSIFIAPILTRILDKTTNSEEEQNIQKIEEEPSLSLKKVA